MNNNEISFSERMENAKLQAQISRNRSQHTGTCAKGWKATKRPDPPKGSWEYLTMKVRAEWRFERNEAIEAYRFAVYPERYEAIEF